MSNGVMTIPAMNLADAGMIIGGCLHGATAAASYIMTAEGLPLGCAARQAEIQSAPRRNMCERVTGAFGAVLCALGGAMTVISAATTAFNSSVEACTDIRCGAFNNLNRLGVHLGVTSDLVITGGLVMTAVGGAFVGLADRRIHKHLNSLAVA